MTNTEQIQANLIPWYSIITGLLNIQGTDKKVICSNCMRLLADNEGTMP